MVISIIALVIVVLLLSIGYYFSRIIIFPKVFPYEETFQSDVDGGRLDGTLFSSWSKEEIQIPTPNGYTLHAIYIPYPDSRRTLVISHGITWSLYGSVKYAALFYKRGFNILMYDLRNHGLSPKSNTSFGFYEKIDLKAMVDWAYARLEPGGIVGTLGESLGAATTLQHAAIDPRISFAIADCSYSDLEQLLIFRLKEEYHLPTFPFIPLANLFTYLQGGWWFQQASPITAIRDVTTPMFFIHGLADTYIPARMSQEMYAAKQKGYRKIFLVPGAEHAGALVTDPVEYDLQIEAFLKDIGIE
jgi:fermentation-respiration switch protein FrsA (DUF1100 family)